MGMRRPATVNDGVTRNGAKSMERLEQDEAAWRDRQPMLTRCMHCAWSFDGPVGAARAEWLKHLAAAHPDVRVVTQRERERRIREQRKRERQMEVAQRVERVRELRVLEGAAPVVDLDISGSGSAAASTAADLADGGAGVAVLSPAAPLPERAPTPSNTRTNTSWTRRLAVERGLAWAVANGRLPARRDVKAGSGLPFQVTVRRLFGGWAGYRKAMLAAAPAEAVAGWSRPRRTRSAPLDAAGVAGPPAASSGDREEPRPSTGPARDSGDIDAAATPSSPPLSPRHVEVALKAFAAAAAHREIWPVLADVLEYAARRLRDAA